MTGGPLEPPATWPGADGAPVSCREKLKVLAENHAEVAQVMRDAFEDAVLMGVDEAAMRRILAELVAALPSPRRPAAGRAHGMSRQGACRRPPPRAVLVAAALLMAGGAWAQAPAPPPAEPDFLPDALWVKRRTAELQMLDKVTARVSVLRVPVDQPGRFGTLTIRVAACFGRPSDEVPDAAAWMEIADSRRAGAARPAGGGVATEGQTVFRGWMFANAPGVSMLEHPVYDVRVLECRDG